MTIHTQIVGGVALCRKLCCKPTVNYTAVNHGLDEEEIAFKNSLEAQNGGDDIDELFNFSGQDELEFDTNDLDNIEMLQVCVTWEEVRSRQILCVLECGGRGGLSRRQRFSFLLFHVGFSSVPPSQRSPRLPPLLRP